MAIIEDYARYIREIMRRDRERQRSGRKTPRRKWWTNEELREAAILLSIPKPKRCRCGHNKFIFSLDRKHMKVRVKCLNCGIITSIILDDIRSV